MNLISVIVPVYNVEQYLNRCIESIVNQTYQNLEIILVDDGSPDNCPIMCDEWAKKDIRIKVIHKENGGLSDARNTGMAVATGEYISFIDSDDWIAPQFYEKLLEALHQDDSDIAACSVEMIWEDGSPSRMLTEKVSCVLRRHEAQAELLAESKLKQPVWYKLYRTSIIKHIEFEKEKYHEDVFWSYQAVGQAKKVSIIDYIGYFYWQRTGSIMGEGYSIKRLDVMEAVCQRYEYYKVNFPELEKVALILIWEECIFQGQMAMTYLEKEKQKKVFSYLKCIQKRYPIHYQDYQNIKGTHQVWIDISRVSLMAVCNIKKKLKVGL
jgi:glycosyltransferase involved in cell wall biosynthesis